MIASLPWLSPRRRARARRFARRDAAAGASLRDDPDADVLALVRAGELQAALRRTMHRHGAGVYRYCRAALHDATLADDVSQQVFIQVFRDLPAFRGGAPLRAWLFAIAHHRVLDAIKARRRAEARIETAEIPEAPDPRPPADELIDEQRLRAALVDGLAALDERARTAVLLRYQQGFTFDEMAEICHEKAHTLGARVTRALPVLRAHIEERLALPRRAARARPVR